MGARKISDADSAAAKKGISQQDGEDRPDHDHRHHHHHHVGASTASSADSPPAPKKSILKHADGEDRPHQHHHHHVDVGRVSLASSAPRKSILKHEQDARVSRLHQHLDSLRTSRMHEGGDLALSTTLSPRSPAQAQKAKGRPTGATKITFGSQISFYNKAGERKRFTGADDSQCMRQFRREWTDINREEDSGEGVSSPSRESTGGRSSGSSLGFGLDTGSWSYSSYYSSAYDYHSSTGS